MQLVDSHLTYGKFYRFSSGDVTSHFNFVMTTALMFLSYTGARFEEMATLTCQHLDLSEGKATFVNTKNKEVRNAYITEPLVSRLARLSAGKSATEYVFTNMNGHKLHNSDFAEDLKKRALAVGIKKRVHPHLLRHTYATHLYIATKDIGMVQVVLGHKDIKSTQIYVHIADELVRKAMRRHPFFRLQVPVHELIDQLDEQIQTVRLHEDPRMNPILVQQAFAELKMRLYGAIIGQRYANAAV